MRLISSAFFRSMHLLDTDGARRSVLGILLVSIILAAWACWFILARVSIYETAASARIEVDRAAHAVESQRAGRITALNMAIGREVQAGDVLIELDSEDQQLQIKEEFDRVAGLNAQLAPLRDEIKAEEATRQEERRATEAALNEARARVREAEVAQSFAEQELNKLLPLLDKGLVPELEILRVRAEAEKRRANADTLRTAFDRLVKEQQTRDAARQARIERLNRDIATITGEINTKTSTVDRLRVEGEKRRVRAPVAGRIGEVADLKAGAFIREGDRLGAIVPAGELRVVAEYQPSEAVGRIRPGQSARVRLDGFNWAQYGTVNARVATVATELRNGHIRVELTVDPAQKFPVTLQHGLPGSVEIEIERVSPATLVLRAAGKLISR